MKKVLAIIGGIIILLLIAMATIPFLFKDQIKNAVIETANKNMNAKVHIDDFGLNMFSNFPNITLSLDNISISGINDFEGDTLVKAKSASATLNILELFKGNYEISKINFSEATVHAKVLADGRTNWDIMKEDESDTQESTSDESKFMLKLQKVSLDNCKVIYDDQAGNMRVILSNWSGDLSGNLSADNTTIKTKSTIDEISFTMDGIPYLTKIEGVVDAAVDADMNNMKFTFVESNVKLNEVKASLDGYVAMTGEDIMDFDLSLKAPNTEFKDILSLLPAMYTDDFKNVKTSGTVSLDGFLKGKMQGENYPAFDFKLIVNDAMFQYPSLPKSVNNINVNMNISSEGGSMDNMIVDISKFNFTMGNNPFSASLNVRTPMSDPNLKANIKGLIDLSMIKEVYPLEAGTDLNGKLNADLSIATRMSAIEKEQYQNVQAAGSLKINDMLYKSNDMPDVAINTVSMEFNPQFVNLSSLAAKIGDNDVSATGRLENFIPYFLKDQTLRGQLNLKSNYFNVNDFMSGEEGESGDSDSENFVVPTNINFTLNADMAKVLYEKVTLTNLNGIISVKDGTINMQNVSANALGGSAKLTGSYSTAQDANNPKVTLAMNISKASFAETFKSVESIQKFAPIFEKVLGTYSMNIDLNTFMGSDIMQMLAGLTANGTIQSNDVKVEGVEALTKLSSALKTDALKSFSAKDINIPFTVNEGKINTKPFSVNIGDGGKLTLGGLTGLDQSIDYSGSVTLPKSLANNYINNVPITIGGTFTSPKIGIDTKNLLSGVADQASEQILGGSIEEKKEELSNKISEEKTKQIQNLRDNAQKASEKLVEEAEKQAKNLVDIAEPKGALAKLAAQKAGEKLVEEAKKNGQKLLDEAEVQIKKLEGQGE